MIRPPRFKIPALRTSAPASHPGRCRGVGAGCGAGMMPQDPFKKFAYVSRLKRFASPGAFGDDSFRFCFSASQLPKLQAKVFTSCHMKHEKRHTCTVGRAWVRVTSTLRGQGVRLVPFFSWLGRGRAGGRRATFSQHSRASSMLRKCFKDKCVFTLHSISTSYYTLRGTHPKWRWVL